MLSVSRPARDSMLNRRHVTAEPRIALVRHTQGLASYYKDFLAWMEHQLPDIRARCELRLLPCKITDWSRYALVVPWIPESLVYRSATARHWAFDLTRAADAHGVPVINRPERLLETSKYDTALRLAELGVRTPKVHRIQDIDGFQRNLNGLQPPLLVREELGHGRTSPGFIVRTDADAREIPLKQFERPMALEFIDVRSPRDGLYRKYRYMAMGEQGVNHSLQISNDWEVRGKTRLLNDATCAEEMAFADGRNKHEQVFQGIRQAMGLDFVAFDYSYDRRGDVVVWEINLLPGLDLANRPEIAHLEPPYDRAMAATVKLYCQRGGLEIPQRVDEILTVRSRVTQTNAVA